MRKGNPWMPKKVTQDAQKVTQDGQKVTQGGQKVTQKASIWAKGNPIFPVFDGNFPRGD